VIKNVNYHYPSINEDDIFYKVKTNQNELAMFLYRIGSEVHKVKRDDLK